MSQEIIKAIVVGIIQGLTEFLPISSSAHLRIVPSFFGWDDIGAGYTAVIQIGTMLAIIIYFWKDLINMISGTAKALKEKKLSDNPHAKLFLNVCIGTIPILIFGYALKNVIDNQFRYMFLIAIWMIVFSVVMFVAERVSKQVKAVNDLTIKDSVIIGLFQAIALLPGTSRSGSTISGGFFLNMKREDAARYSFLLSIPAILISGLYKLYSDRKFLLSDIDSISTLVIATIVSGIVGYLSIWFLLNYVKKNSLNIFIIYRILFGTAVIILLLTNIIKN